MAENVNPAALCSRCRCALLPPSAPSSSPSMAQLRANSIPLLSEIPTITKKISERAALHAHYDAEISRLTKETEKLRDERKRISRSLRKYRSLLAPIRRLPVEVLTLIFEACCEERDEVDNNLATPRGLSPLNIGLVCWMWRNITLTTPQLWAYISVMLEAATSKRTVELVNLFLKHSQRHPLKIEIFDQSWPGGNRSGLSLDIAKALALHCRRFRRLQLGTLGHTFIGLIDSRNLVQLESLYISAVTALEPSLQFAPNLRDVELVDFKVIVGQEPLPYDQITHVKVEDTYVDSSLEVLAPFQNITCASLRLYRPSFTPMTWSPKHLSSITLTLCCFPEAHYEDDPVQLLKETLESITLPALTSMSVTCRTRGSVPWAHTHFADMISRSQCSLKQLALQNFTLSESQLLHVFEATPTLTHITIQERDDIASSAFSATLLQRLIHSMPTTANYATNSDILLPNLENIDLTLCPSFDDSRTLTDVIESRWMPPSVRTLGRSGISCLEEVTLCFPNEVDLAVMSRLREFRREGLNVWLPWPQRAWSVEEYESS